MNHESNMCCGYCTSYKLCGRTVQYFKWRKDYDNWTIHQKQERHAEDNQTVWVTACATSMIPGLIYLTSNENNAKFYWVY